MILKMKNLRKMVLMNEVMTRAEMRKVFHRDFLGAHR